MNKTEVVKKVHALMNDKNNYTSRLQAEEVVEKYAEQRTETGQVDDVVSDKLVDDFGFEVQGLNNDLPDLDWNKALIRHARWIKEHAENVAGNLLDKNLR